MDADYGRNLDRDGAPTKAFEPSLFVWATVMSRPALAFDSGPSLVCDEPPRPTSARRTSTAASAATNRLGPARKLVNERVKYAFTTMLSYHILW